MPKPVAQEPLPIVPPVPLTPTIEHEAEAPVTQHSLDDLEPDQQARVKDRMTRLRELSRRLRTASGLSELEDVPAYKRRAVSLEEVPHSSESQVSKYSLDDVGNDGDKKTEVGRNNSFLHDNVD